MPKPLKDIGTLFAKKVTDDIKNNIIIEFILIKLTYNFMCKRLTFQTLLRGNRKPRFAPCKGQFSLETYLD